MGLRALLVGLTLFFVSASASSDLAGSSAKFDALLARIHDNSTPQTIHAVGPHTIHYASDEGDDAAPPKHVPVLSIDLESGMATVSVQGADADSLHPQTAGHYIAEIYVFGPSGLVHHAALDPLSPAGPVSTFKIPDGDGELTPWEFCSKHGLWSGKPVSVVTGTVMPSHLTQQFHDLTHGVDGDTDAAQVHPADPLEPQPRGHEPFLTVDREAGTATVSVRGAAGSDSLHPQTEQHRIVDIYILGSNEVVHHADMRDAAVATTTFQIPVGAIELTPWANCNKDGLWGGQPIWVATGARSGRLQTDMCRGTGAVHALCAARCLSSSYAGVVAGAVMRGA
jgi:desulfoferrodoxin (superoxide reductase-like protein)